VVGFGVEGVVVFFWAFAGLCRVWGHPACGPRVSPWVVRCVVGYALLPGGVGEVASGDTRPARYALRPAGVPVGCSLRGWWGDLAWSWGLCFAA
jgi:hypothetical protein